MTTTLNLDMDMDMDMNMDGGAGRKKATDDLFSNTLLEKRVVLPITEINADLETNLLKFITKRLDGKCIEEGWVLASSVTLEQYSAGNLTSSGVEFIVIFRCKICRPVEGMVLEAVISDITKAGVHAFALAGNGQKPLNVYILRDHEYLHPLFSDETKMKRNAPITVKIVGIRYELNDPSIHAIAEFAD